MEMMNQPLLNSGRKHMIFFFQATTFSNQSLPIIQFPEQESSCSSRDSPQQNGQRTHLNLLHHQPYSERHLPFNRDLHHHLAVGLRPRDSAIHVLFVRSGHSTGILRMVANPCLMPLLPSEVISRWAESRIHPRGK